MATTIEQYPPYTENAVIVMGRRYLVKDPETKKPIEEPDNMFERVGNDLAEADRGYGATDEQVAATSAKFYGIMRRLEFLPNSPTLMNAGRELQQLSACFVLPIEDNLDSIFTRVRQTALIHQSGGGTGFAFSRLRPEGDIVKSTGGVASGPTSFIRPFDVATDVVKQGGTRRGANMAILSVYHPDVEKFVLAKRDGSSLENFNVSVAVDRAFMDRVEKNEVFDTVNPRNGEKCGQQNAKALFDLIVECAWETGDPGLVFLDRINDDNPNPHLGTIESTNPCGEQPLLPWESCNLGSINLRRMLTDGPNPEIDQDKLKRICRSAVHMLDNVIDRNEYPVPEIGEMTRATRRIGVGVMGWADVLTAMGVRYDSEEALELAGQTMKIVRQAVQEATEQLAMERGAYPAWEGSRYEAAGSTEMRNSAPTTIAPTGTISVIAGVSSGIEPLFALAYKRNVLDGEVLLELNDDLMRRAEDEGFMSEALMRSLKDTGTIGRDVEVPDRVRNVFRTSQEIDPIWHVRMQAAFQAHTENAVSKTINLPFEATHQDVADAYRAAWELGCKGITVYRDGSKSEQVLATGRSGAETGRDKLIPRARPAVLDGQAYRVRTGHGNAYIIINKDDIGELFEVFAVIGKAGSCDSVTMHALTRLISLALRTGVDPLEVIEQLRGNTCCPAFDDGVLVQSSADAIAIAMQRALGIDVHQFTQDEVEVQMTVPGLVRGRQRCPECNGFVVRQGNCPWCPQCNWSKC